MKGRGRKAIENTLFAFLQEFVAVVCSFILPRLILGAFGSTYNGITSSITQFLGCAALLRAGVGGATRAALYKPIANNNQKEISAIMNATSSYMRKLALILAGSILLFACIYPLATINEFSWLFSFSLFVIIGISTFAENFFGISNLILLQADQRLYVSSIARIISTIVNTVISVILIKMHFSIHIVKLGSAIAFCLYPFILHLYVRHKYTIDPHESPDMTAISQRWDAFFHQVANFVMNNTDVIVLTVFVPMKEVSVYSVYALVANGLKKLVLNFTSGLEAAFGNMFALNQQDQIKKNFKLIEYMIYSIATIVYACTAVLLLDFVSIYTHGITDAEYIRPLFAYLLIISQFFLCVRQPYQMIVQAAGKYKETRNGAIFEPILNIVISIIMVFKFGLIGVVVGTLAAILFRTFQYSWYVDKNLIKGCFSTMIIKNIISFVESVLIIYFFNLLPLTHSAGNYFDWIVNSIVAVFCSVVVIGLGSVLFYRDELLSFIKMVTGLFKRRRKV